MTLNDEIIDIAQEMAEQRILNDPTDAQIVDAINEIIDVNLAFNSVGARLAIATYNKFDQQIKTCERIYAL